LLTCSLTAINRPAAETNLGEMKDIFSVNVFAVIDITQTFLPELIAAKGTIVNIGSVVGHMPIPYSAVYCGSKAALYAYSESLRLEVAPLGVKVTYIQTANVKTNIFRGRTTLNDNSLWIEAREAFDHTQEQAATTGMEPEAYAKSLTSQLVSGHRNVRWVGEGAFMVWFMLELQKFLPFQIITPLLTKLYGLDKVERPKDKDV
jgi:1-acylglycerone phosphate reductase